MRQIQRWSARLVVCDAAAPDPSTSAAIIPSRASFDLGCQARIVSSRKKRRGREAEDRTLPEELFGLAWARLLRVGVPVFSLVLLVGGCFVFVVWSQVMGQLLLAAGLGLGLMWFVLRRGDPKGALAALRRRRRPLIAIGFGLIAGRPCSRWWTRTSACCSSFLAPRR